MIIDELISILGYRLEGQENLDRFNKGMDQAQAHAQRFAQRMSTMQIALGSFIGNIASNLAMRLGHAIGSIPGDILNVGKAFEGYKIQLTALEGSQEAANKAMDWITDFAKRTPLDLEGVVKAYAQMRTFGLDPTNGDRLSQTWRDLLPAGTPLCVLSGPNHAEEIAVRQPAAAVVAGDRSLARAIQEHLSGPRFRLYVNDDLVGVELCGAAKNVIAIAAGMSDGVGFGDNCKATLITRGLAEMTRLGVACGASEATFRGLAGMGDLVATCTSRHSRNRRAGEMIARGTGADMIEGDIGQVAEGLWTVARLRALAEARGVELPISAEVAAIAFGGRPVLASLEALMTRAPAVEE